MEPFSYSFETLGSGHRVCVSPEHKFGTDAFLLARFSGPAKGDLACDLGSGCGIIPLIWLGSPCLPQAVYGVELQEQGVAQMKIACCENHLEHLFFPIWGDLSQPESLRKQLPWGRFDLVACNPPYKAAGTGVPCPGEARLTARHEVACTLEDVCAAAAGLLRFGGRFCLCQRPHRLPDVLQAMRGAGLEPKRLRFVQQRADSEPWLFLAEGRRGGRPFLRVEPPLIVETPGGGFSQEMQSIYGR